MTRLMVGYLLALALVSAISFGLIYLLRRGLWSQLGRLARQRGRISLKARAPKTTPSPPPDEIGGGEYGQLATARGPRSLGQGLLALLMAAGGQYAFAHEWSLIGVALFVFASILFGHGMRGFLANHPIKPATESAVASGALSQVDTDKGAAVPPGSATDLSLGERVRFFRAHWEEVTLADVLAGLRIPEAFLETGVGEFDSAAPAGAEQELAPPARPVSQEIDEAHIETWVCAEPLRPQGVVITEQGYLIVVDAIHKLIHFYNRQGHLIGQWSVPNLPKLTGTNLAAAPDGTLLYISDEENRQIMVISLLPGAEQDHG